MPINRLKKTPLLARLLALVIILAALGLGFPALAAAQTAGEESAAPALPLLSGPQKQTLLLIARESITAALEQHSPREATVEPRLTAPQPMVVSIYVDGILRGRAWRLRGYQPLYLAARDLTYEALAESKVAAEPLSFDELTRAVVSLAVLSNYNRAKDDLAVPPRSAVIIYSGFVEWLALPGDVDSDEAGDLLRYACAQAGLRPNIWLLPQTTIYSASVEMIKEGPGN